MNGGYPEISEKGRRLGKYSDVSSNLEDIIAELNIRGKIDSKKLTELYNRSFELHKSLLGEEDLGEIFNGDLKYKIRIVNRILTDLFNKYNIQSSANRAHNDSRTMNLLIVVLTSVMALQNAIVFPDFTKCYGVVVNADVLLLGLLAFFYIIIYLSKKDNNIVVYVNPEVWETA
jgi:hypothetical protein